jgi:hypothetical protein
VADPHAQQLELLLEEAANAHHRYEIEELAGERNEEWAAWYARYAIENGIGEIVTTEPGGDQLATLLQDIADEHDVQGSDESWATFAAQRLAAALD